MKEHFTRGKKTAKSSTKVIEELINYDFNGVKKESKRKYELI